LLEITKFPTENYKFYTNMALIAILKQFLGLPCDSWVIIRSNICE